MKRMIKKLCFGAVCCLTAGCENPQTGETLPYWYTDPIVSIEPTNRSFTILHTPEGLVGTDAVKMPFSVFLSKSVSEEVRVRLALEIEGDGLSEWVSLADGDTVVIPAGETAADTSLSIPDWSFAQENKAAAEWTLSVRIESVVSGTARISTNLNLAVWQIDKSGYSNIRTDWEPTGTKTQKPDEWIMSVSTDSESSDWQVSDVLMDGFIGTGSVKNEGYLGVQIDLGAVETVNGLVANFTKSNTCYRELSVETSDDGQLWSPQGTVSAAWEAAYQSVTFTEPVETRYIRWHMFSEGTIDLDEVSVVLPGA